MITLIDLVPGLKKKSAKEYFGPCPWCGGTDRFIVWPFQGKGGRYLCRQCQNTGDALDLLMKLQGLKFVEACDRLGVEKSNLGKIGGLGLGTLAVQEKDSVDRNAWANSATSFVKTSISHSDPETLREWNLALSGRHIRFETAKRFGIGWNPSDIYVASEIWGLSGNRKLKIPRGLVIPTHRKNGVVGLKIRRPTNDPKYWQIRGGTSDCMVLGKEGLPTIIVESDLDGYLIWQEAHDLVSVISTGGTTKGIDPTSAKFLSTTPKIFISTDYDEPTRDGAIAGQQAYYRLQQQYPSAVYLPPARGKDPCEMHSQRVPVRSWISCALNPETEHLPLQLPADFPGGLERFKRDTTEHPHLVPCPKTTPKWYWRYRTACQNCTGHVQCLKDFPTVDS